MSDTDTLAGRLTRTLVLWVGGIWLLSVLAVVWYVDREINYNFDNELVEVSHRMFDIAAEELDRRLPDKPSDAPLIAPTPLFHDAAVIYQLVDGNERVLMRSAETPPGTFDVPVSPGFANLEKWRVYTVRHPTRNLYLQVADPLDERRDTLNRTLVGLLVPLIAVLPLLAFLLRRIARNQLQVLRQLANEIARRSGTDLRAIDLPGLPRELKLVGDDVNRLLERLSHSLDVERALAANAAHELRTPLTAARLRLQTALDHDLRRTDVEAALEALRTLAHRAEKLLQLSRAESGASLTRGRVDLVRLAASVAQEFWQEARARDRLDLEVPETETVPMAIGDDDALAIALRNLIENSLNYAGKSRVLLAVTTDCTLIVRDTGPGVSAAELLTLQQRHMRHTAERTGYGLGMSIVATIVTKHDARLELRSPPEGAASGFEARIVLPRA
ncbi:HAMP domain-containing sensor histidine kinase [Variovorax rhizosphaerae]|uniref:histidine kinase n=1 Tax=Variovorax rhizosphaerae TaxID=1836200 RepID=A0ABU8WJC2_9BURK